VLEGARILVIEDSPVVAPYAVDVLGDLGCEVVGPAPNMAAARELVEQGEFDAALMDVHIRGERVFPLCDMLEAQAVDYLVKPVEPERLADALDRVRQRLSEKRGVAEVERLKSVLAEVAPEAAEEFEGETAPDTHAADRYEKMINIKDRGQIFRVDVDSIERIDAAGDYMCIYTADNSLILRETMKDLEKRLDPRNFQRVHRSTIVNLSQVKQVKPHTNGECFLVLGSGAQVKVSRSYRDVVARFVH
jgi:two-component system LytT family response regulator